MQRRNRLYRLQFSLGMRAKLGQQNKRKKLKKRQSNISPICLDAPTGAIVLNFGFRGDTADLTTHAKCCDNRFRDFGVLTFQILPLNHRPNTKRYGRLTCAQMLTRWPA